jgi:hypothetical protein
MKKDGRSESSTKIEREKRKVSRKETKERKMKEIEKHKKKERRNK